MDAATSTLFCGDQKWTRWIGHSSDEPDKYGQEVVSINCTSMVHRHRNQPLSAN